MKSPEGQANVKGRPTRNHKPFFRCRIKRAPSRVHQIACKTALTHAPTRKKSSENLKKIHGESQAERLIPNDEVMSFWTRPISSYSVSRGQAQCPAPCAADASNASKCSDKFGRMAFP